MKAWKDGLTWQQLGFEVRLDVSEATIRRTMGTMDYHKCLACQGGWQSPKSAANRVQYAKVMLERHPEPEDWDRVRFIDEVRFGWGAQHQLRIIRKPGERYCIDCVQPKEEPKPKDEKRFHCWAAAGYNFKSDLTFYEVPGNTNRKMSLQVYINQILEPVVKSWIVQGHDCALGEDGKKQQYCAKVEGRKQVRKLFQLCFPT